MNDTTAKPNAQTHIAEVTTIPLGDGEWTEGRAPLEAPTLWKSGVKVIHKLTGREAVIFRMDLGTMQFRAYYPDENRLDARTEWQHAINWNVKVTLHPDELARRKAREELDQAIASLDADELAAVEALVDGDDPTKGLAKIQALRKLGVIKGRADALAAATALAEDELLAKAAQLDAAQRQARPRKAKPEGA